MLLKLSNEIRHCYRHAVEARRKADAAYDPVVKQDFLDMERRWIALARSYELSEQISRFCHEASRRKT